MICLCRACSGLIRTLGWACPVSDVSVLIVGLNCRTGCGTDLFGSLNSITWSIPDLWGGLGVYLVIELEKERVVLAMSTQCWFMQIKYNVHINGTFNLRTFYIATLFIQYDPDMTLLLGMWLTVFFTLKQNFPFRHYISCISDRITDNMIFLARFWLLFSV